MPPPTRSFLKFVVAAGAKGDIPSRPLGCRNLGIILVQSDDQSAVRVGENNIAPPRRVDELFHCSGETAPVRPLFIESDPLA